MSKQAKPIPDYYNTLGVARNATGKQIHEAWKQLAIKFGRDEKDIDKLHEVNTAKACLTDDKSRAIHDQSLNNKTGVYSFDPASLAEPFFRSYREKEAAQTIQMNLNSLSSSVSNDVLVADCIDLLRREPGVKGHWPVTPIVLDICLDELV